MKREKERETGVKTKERESRRMTAGAGVCIHAAELYMGDERERGGNVRGTQKRVECNVVGRLDGSVCCIAYATWSFARASGNDARK